MNEPYKVIHKYKNINNQYQYITFIFIGNYVSDEVMDVLEYIKSKDLFTSLSKLTKQKVNLMEKHYGNFWYRYFFNKRHIIISIKDITSSKMKKNELITKFGQKWYDKHINISNNISKIKFNYSDNYYNYIKQKEKLSKKLVKKQRDFTTHKDIFVLNENITESIEDIIEERRKQFGGFEQDNEQEEQEEEQEENKVQEDNENMEINDELNEDEMIDFNELDKLYDDIDKKTDVNRELRELEKISKDVGKALNDKKWEKDSKKTEIEYNTIFDDNVNEPLIEESYEKEYITDQYIYADDSIRTIKNKISVSIPLNPKYGDIKLLPSYQYLWGEYVFDNKIDEIMIGTKWIRRNNLLKVDIVPNKRLEIYEDLKDTKLSYLKDNFNYKIIKEDENDFILDDYGKYIDNNDIYLLDIINELGLNYETDEVKMNNLYSVYCKIYFSELTETRFNNIIKLLNNETTPEIDINKSDFLDLSNNLKIETEITNLVEETKFKLKDRILLENNHILQCTVSVDLYNEKNRTGTISNEKINLYRIFNNFNTTQEFPFIQIIRPDNQTNKFKKDEKILDRSILKEWFEPKSFVNSLNIKILRETNREDSEKYLSITLLENGLIRYRISWEETNYALIEDISKSFNLVNSLIKKINSENKKIRIIEPDEDLYKYIFINSISKINFKKKVNIDHNKLSDFIRLFYPYLAVEREPKKRVAKLKDDSSKYSKYGTYLRYKRIKNYNNKVIIEKKILYFIRNYSLSDKDLIIEIANNLNISDEQAEKEINNVKEKYKSIINKLKGTRKTMEKIKTNKQGVDIKIQGRDNQNYKLRIDGSRSKKQLNNILDLMNTILYLYMEIYVNKNSRYQKYLKTLESLNKVAKRRNQVLDYVDHDKEKKDIKQAINLDKKRLGYKPTENQNHWSRDCQNSGKIKRQPKVISQSNEGELLKLGYKLNKENGFYEKQVIEDGKKVILKAAKLSSGETDNYFVCDPSLNNDYKYVGFLTKNNNPANLCAPCCFKKNRGLSANEKIKMYHNKCLYNNEDIIEEIEDNFKLGDKVYIVTKTNKLQDGRFMLLPKFVDYFFNIIIKNDKKIINNHFTNSKSGYFFKYTVKRDSLNFLHSIAHVYEITVDEIKDKMINFLINEDKDDRYFSYLNNGEIKLGFESKKNYIDFIKTSKYIDYENVGELLEIPGVLDINGIFFYIIDKKKIKNTNKNKYFLSCLNNENSFMIREGDRTNIIFMREQEYYFPVYNLKKEKTDKKIVIKKSYSDEPILRELRNYFNISCINNIIFKITNNNLYYNKNIIEKIIDNNIKIKKQYLDDKNKCRYLELDNKLILPIIISGSSYKYNIDIIDNIKFNNLNDTIKKINEFEKKLNLDYKPQIVYYDNIKNNKINVVSIKFKNKLVLPIKNELMDVKIIKKLKLEYKERTLESKINEQIIQENTDDYINNEEEYINESYNILRLELSMFLEENQKYKKSIIQIVRDDNLTKNKKIDELYKILINILNKKIDSKKIGSSNDDLVHVVDSFKNLKQYKINNIRDYCGYHKKKEKCEVNLHCMWVSNSCKLQLKYNDLMKFINRLLYEIIQDKIKFKEIIQEDDYFVSDVIDKNKFDRNDDELVVNVSNINVKNILKELFDEEFVFKHKNKNKNKNIIEDKDINTVVLKDRIIQPVVNNKDSIIRAFVNSYYWLKNTLYDEESRNLGYENELQTRLTYILKAHIIDFIMNNNNNKNLNSDLLKLLKEYNNEDIINSKLNKLRKSTNNTNGFIELLILNELYNIPIVIIDNKNKLKYIIDKKIYDTKLENKKYDNKETIILKFDYENSDIPSNISNIFYK